MGEDYGRKLHANTNVYTVGLGGNVHVLANRFHPLTSGTTYRDNAFIRIKIFFLGMEMEAVFLQLFHLFHRTIKMEFHLILKLGIKIFQYHVIDICTQMANGSIQKLQTILHAKLLKLCSCGGEKSRSLSSVFHIDFIYIPHQRKSFLFSDIFVKCSPKIIGNIVFSVGEGPGSSKAAHNGTAFTGNTAFNLLSVNRTMSLFQAMSRFQNHHGKLTVFFHQLVSRVNSSWSCTNNRYIIFLHPSLL